MLADALVDADTEADVPGGVAGEVEGVRVDPLTGIAVRGAEEHEDLAALGYDDVADALAKA